jgi:hypothetical protein
MPAEEIAGVASQATNLRSNYSRKRKDAEDIKPESTKSRQADEEAPGGPSVSRNDRSGFSGMGGRTDESAATKGMSKGTKGRDQTGKQEHSEPIWTSYSGSYPTTIPWHHQGESAIIEAWMPHLASVKVVQEEEQHPVSARPDFQNEGEAPFEQPAAPPDLQHDGETTHSKQGYDDELESATCAEEYSHPPVEVDAILKALGSLGVSLQLTSSEQMDAVVEEVIAAHGA